MACTHQALTVHLQVACVLCLMMVMQVLSVVLLALSMSGALGTLTVSNVLGSNMVLQRGVQVCKKDHSLALAYLNSRQEFGDGTRQHTSRVYQLEVRNIFNIYFCAISTSTHTSSD